MNKHLSFISEHTAEYALIENIKKKLKAQFKYVIPVFPWATREGCTLSRLIHSGDEFLVFGFYPRRPKIFIGQTEISFTINNELIEAAIIAAEFNIPMFAGFPIARNLWELDSPKCLWLKLTNKCVPIYQFENTAFFSKDGRRDIFTTNEILKEINDNAKVHNLSSFIEATRIIKQNRSNRFFVFGGYKPIYFLLR